MSGDSDHGLLVAFGVDRDHEVAVWLGIGISVYLAAIILLLPLDAAGVLLRVGGIAFMLGMAFGTHQLRHKYGKTSHCSDCPEGEFPICTYRLPLINEMIEEFDDPVVGRYRQPRPAARFSETPARVRRSAPRLGEHTREVLTGTGFSDAEINALLGSGALAEPG